MQHSVCLWASPSSPTQFWPLGFTFQVAYYFDNTLPSCCPWPFPRLLCRVLGVPVEFSCQPRRQPDKEQVSMMMTLPGSVFCPIPLLPFNFPPSGSASDNLVLAFPLPLNGRQACHPISSASFRCLLKVYSVWTSLASPCHAGQSPWHAAIYPLLKAGMAEAKALLVQMPNEASHKANYSWLYYHFVFLLRDNAGGKHKTERKVECQEMIVLIPVLLSHNLFLF